MHQVAEQLLATLDKVGFKAALNLCNLVIVLVADNTKRDSHPRFACAVSCELYLHPRPLEGVFGVARAESNYPKIKKAGV